MCNRQKTNSLLEPLFLATSLLALAGCPGPVVGGGSTTLAGDDTGDETGSDTGGDTVDDHRSYFIGESTTFEGGGTCNNTNLTTITSTLRNKLDSSGWKGLRLVDANSWPEDFQDPSTNPLGLDGDLADTVRLAMYAGHGNVGQLQWGTPSDNNACQMSIPLNARLGTLAGDRTAAMMFMTSCTLRTDALMQTLQFNASRQFFGYHNSPYIGYDEPKKVYKRTEDGQSTIDAWLEEMEENIDVGKNSPVVVTFGTSFQDALDHHNSTNLATGEGLITNVGEPAVNFIFTWFNNGCTPGCGNCAPTPPPSLPADVDMGTPLPLVELERPKRSEAQLVSAVQFMLPLFGASSTDPATHTRLEVWAHNVGVDGEVTFAEISHTPRVSVSYDPVDDRLHVSDIDALELARSSLLAQPAPEHGASHVMTLADLRPRAAEFRDALQAEMAVGPLGISFATSTREVGYLDPTVGFSGSTPIEYRFEVSGQVDSLELPARSLRVGITRLGELSSITLAGMNATVIDAMPVVRTPKAAMTAFEAALLAQHPAAVSIDFFDVSIGYALPEESPATVIEPSVILRYALTFAANGGEPMVSRSEAVSLSLVSSQLHPASLSATNPIPPPGDARPTP